MRIAIETHGVGKRYGRRWALRQCSFEIPAGRTVALVGPNGAGKTTLLHLVAGLIDPSEGTIALNGSPVTQSREALRRIGFLAQERPLYQSFSVAEMLEVGRRLNEHWDQPVAEGRLARFEIPLDQKVRHLSGGQQAQVALALALGKRPDILLLDEPVASLDPLARQQFLEEINQVGTATGMTIVLSSHVLAELERTCDYLVILNRGQVQLAGEVRELLDTDRASSSEESASASPLEDLVLRYLRRPAVASTAAATPAVVRNSQ